MRVLIVFMLASVALAGCAGSPEVVETTGFVPPAVEVDDDTGVIRGIVVDAAITPIQDVLVSVANTELSAVTDENGYFQILDVEPNTYFLEATKDAFTTVQSSTTVVAGDPEPPLVRIQIDLIPGALPAVTSIFYDAFIQCGFKAANFVFDAGWCDPAGATGLSANDDSSATFDAGRPDAPSHFQSEVLWKANQPLSSGLVTIQCNDPDTACGSGTGSSRICNVRGASPLVCRVNNDIAPEDIGGGGNNFNSIHDGTGWQQEFSIGLFSNCAVQCVSGAVGAGAAIDQNVEFYVNIFYNVVPDEEWMFTENGAYEFE